MIPEKRSATDKKNQNLTKESKRVTGQRIKAKVSHYLKVAPNKIEEKNKEIYKYWGR